MSNLNQMKIMKIREMRNRVRDESRGLINRILPYINYLTREVFDDIQQLLTNGVIDIFSDSLLKSNMDITVRLVESLNLEERKTLTILSERMYLPLDIFSVVYRSDNPMGRVRSAIDTAKLVLKEIIIEVERGEQMYNYNNMAPMPNNQYPYGYNGYNNFNNSNMYGSVNSMGGMNQMAMNQMIVPSNMPTNFNNNVSSTISSSRYDDMPNTQPNNQMGNQGSYTNRQYKNTQFNNVQPTKPKPVYATDWLTANGVNVKTNNEAVGVEEEELFIEVNNEELKDKPMTKDEILDVFLFSNLDNKNVFKQNTYSKFKLKIKAETIIPGIEDFRCEFARLETAKANLVLYRYIKTTIDNIVTDYGDVESVINNQDSIRVREELTNKIESIYKDAMELMNSIKVIDSSKEPNTKKYKLDYTNNIYVLYSKNVIESVSKLLTTIGNDIGKISRYSYRSLFNVIDRVNKNNEPIQLLVLHKNKYVRMVFDRKDLETYHFVILDHN